MTAAGRSGARGRRRRVDAEDHAPEEDRAFERAPQRDDGEDQRRRAAAHLRHVLDAEVVRRAARTPSSGSPRACRGGSRTTAAEDQASAPPGGAARPTMPATAAERREEQSARGPGRSRGWSSSGLRRRGVRQVRLPLVGPVAGLRGRGTVGVVHHQARRGEVCDLSKVPSTTTPIRSRNICGGVSRETTFTEVRRACRCPRPGRRGASSPRPT